jgi:catechol 2,3-dioxygenase-like lactoylglutathione lyase family enzyme
MLKLDHVAVEVSDLDASMAFYGQKLGLELMFCQLDAEHHERFAFFKLAGGNLELLQSLDDQNHPIPFPKQAPRRSNCPHVAIGTGDLDAVLQLLEAEGIPLLKGPLEIPGQVRWLYASDPDGNIIEFVQWMNPENS